MNGIQATKRIVQELPEVILVGISVAMDPPTEQAMIDAGAAACLSKDRAGDEIHGPSSP